jgi:ribose transport system ATP-binding protein
VAENAFLGHEQSRLGFTGGAPRRHGRGDPGPARARRDLAAPAGPPLPAAGKQIVSMARALSHDAS